MEWTFEFSFIEQRPDIGVPNLFSMPQVLYGTENIVNYDVRLKCWRKYPLF